jgi:hypothetical protein
MGERARGRETSRSWAGHNKITLCQGGGAWKGYYTHTHTTIGSDGGGSVKPPSLVACCDAASKASTKLIPACATCVRVKEADVDSDYVVLRGTPLSRCEGWVDGDENGCRRFGIGFSRM